MGHRQRCLPAEAAFCLGGSVADGGIGAFDRVAGPDVFPMLGREVVEGEQIGAVLGEAFDGAVIFHARQASTKKSKAALAPALVSAIQIALVSTGQVQRVASPQGCSCYEPLSPSDGESLASALTLKKVP